MKHFSQRLVAQNQHLISVSLRHDREPIEENRGEIIIDLNHYGNWIRGFEIVGGFVPFSVEKAVLPFNPVLPSPKSDKPGTVTYDPEADAAFFYFNYAPRFGVFDKSKQSDLTKVSHSVNPTAVYGLDELGGLVTVKIPIADVSGSVEQFLELLQM